MTLSEFLLARIAEDEESARGAYYEGQRWYSEEEIVSRWPEMCDCDPPVISQANRKVEAEHIATWDPARVLAECDARRRIVGWYISLAEQIDNPALEIRHNELGAVLRSLALPYADHPDYDEAWRP